MALPRRCYFKPKSAGEVKVFKFLASRKGIANFEKGNNLPHKCWWNYSYLEKGSNPSRNSQRRLVLGNGTSFHHSERKLALIEHW